MSPKVLIGILCQTFKVMQVLSSHAVAANEQYLYAWRPIRRAQSALLFLYEKNTTKWRDWF